ncbi:nuclease-related domain-containing protein [Pseudonocardia sp.]|uniref:nuclease-related domain-containing protein n=1 Tax=Pseudonocardia sp. TaxID=60912 RepID=UPI00345441B0
MPETSITHEATRRRVSEGAGADRSWRVGADGEFAVAELLVELNPVSLIPWPRRKPPAWRVLHSVPVGDGRTDIDHVLIGPPGVVTINTEHPPPPRKAGPRRGVGGDRRTAAAHPALHDCPPGPARRRRDLRAGPLVGHLAHPNRA